MEPPKAQRDVPGAVQALIPDVEKVIADFKGGNYPQALTDALALEPEVMKAYTDCTASEKVEGPINCFNDVKNLIQGVE